MFDWILIPVTDKIPLVNSVLPISIELDEIDENNIEKEKILDDLRKLQFQDKNKDEENNLCLNEEIYGDFHKNNIKKKKKNDCNIF